VSCGTVISRWAMWCVMAAVVVLLAACGGGGGGNDRGGNNAPVAVAGASSSGTVCVVVTLDGSASYDADGDELAFSWSITSRPAQSNANLTGTNPARPSFTADKPGTYTLRLLVSDGRSESAPSTVTYTGVLGPDIPVANAGSAQSRAQSSGVSTSGRRVSASRIRSTSRPAPEARRCRGPAAATPT